MRDSRGFFRALLVAGCALAGGAGCGSKDAVSVSASIGSASLAITQGLLVDELSGGFDLELALGKYASEGTRVEAQTFAVVRGDTVLIEGLSVTTDRAFPVELEPGDEVVIPFDVAEDASVDETITAALCDGPLRIHGAITDSASGRPTPVESPPLEVSCP